MNIEYLLGRIIREVQHNDQIITFVMDDGAIYDMYHSQDCCESVMIESIVGDLQGLVGTPLLVAECSYEKVEPTDDDDDEWSSYESRTWSFYKLATINGHVDIRWHGSSNGYYSETADLHERSNSIFLM